MDHDVTKIQKPHKVCKLSGPSAAIANMTDLFICSSCRVRLADTVDYTTVSGQGLVKGRSHLGV